MTRAGEEMSLTSYGKPLMAVSSFKYMGVVLMALYDGCPYVVSNLRKVWKKWARMSRVLVW